MVSETENGPDPKGDAAAIAASAFSLYRGLIFHLVPQVCTVPLNRELPFAL